MPTSHVTTTRNTGRKPAMPVISATRSAAETGMVATAAAQPVQRPPVDADTRRSMIAEAAYYRAERRGFAPGGELDDWLLAEAQTESMLGK